MQWSDTGDLRSSYAESSVADVVGPAGGGMWRLWTPKHTVQCDAVQKQEQSPGS